jgi:hypothetical protein
MKRVTTVGPPRSLKWSWADLARDDVVGQHVRGVVMDDSLCRHDDTVATQFHAFDMLWESRIDALPESANVLGALWQGFGAALQDGLGEHRIPATRGVGLGNVFRHQTRAVEHGQLAVVDLGPVAFEDPSRCRIGRPGKKPRGEKEKHRQ